MSSRKRILLAVVGLWILGTIVAIGGKSKDHAPPKSEPQALTQPKENSSSGQKTVEQLTGSQCYDKGDAIATVFLANIKQAIEVGMLASEMMEKGCQQAVGAVGDSCVADCRLGFKAKAKAWVKDGSL